MATVDKSAAARRHDSPASATAAREEVRTTEHQWIRIEPEYEIDGVTRFGWKLVIEWGEWMEWEVRNTLGDGIRLGLSVPDEWVEGLNIPRSEAKP